LSFFVWQLNCLTFDLWLLINLLVSSNLSYKFSRRVAYIKYLRYLFVVPFNLIITVQITIFGKYVTRIPPRSRWITVKVSVKHKSIKAISFVSIHLNVYDWYGLSSLLYVGEMYIKPKGVSTRTLCYPHNNSLNPTGYTFLDSNTCSLRFLHKNDVRFVFKKSLKIPKG
jgi:hypothetical protein